MAKKGALYSLIKSLTKSEKRYFKLNQTVTEGTKNYLKVFDFVDTQEEMDDKAMAAHFSNQSYGRQFHVTKNYLSKQILKSLRGFYASSSYRHQLHELLLDIEILYKKELYDQCYDAVKRARKVAEKYEKFTELLEVLSWERRLLIAQKGSVKAAIYVNQIIRYEAEVLEKLSNINQYVHLAYNIFDESSNENSIDVLRKYPLVADKQNALSFSALTLYYHLQYVVNAFGGNPESGLGAITTLIDEFEKRPHLIKENPDSYVTALNNKMGALLHMKRPVHEAIDMLTKIRAVPDRYGLKQDNHTVKIFMKTYNVELELYRDTKEWQKGGLLINEIQSFLQNNLSYIADSYLVSFYYQFAYINFKLKHFSSSLKNLNEIINDLQSAERHDIQVYARFLLLIIHYELGNIIVLKYAVDATRRFLNKLRKPQTFEKRLLKFFSKLSTSATFDHREIFKDFSQEIFKDIDDHQKAEIIDYLDFSEWLHEKI
ncbi:hypothetical protein E1176_17885 [Fulvivirga sp. RKSG066]|uniref:hypothetical protein n=1 Tax=Fulvivirga aurantia TaxID=2529383 RepID=UPI0012BC1F16|nr:hypothetical protein [Fulvivirga aurantia]MTI22908.1 hypothetical protein [Fulvivirga aurantia]